MKPIKTFSHFVLLTGTGRATNKFGRAKWTNHQRHGPFTRFSQLALPGQRATVFHGLIRRALGSVWWACSLVAFVVAAAAAEPDVILNGETLTMGGGQYGSIFVKNDGDLTVTGEVWATEARVRWGTITFHSNFHIERIVIEAASPASLTAYGSSNTVREVLVESGSLLACGRWFASEVMIRSNGTLKIIPYSGTLPESGTFLLQCDNFELDLGASLNGDVGGNDSRGRGGGSGPGGGGYGGPGGKSFWGDSRGGATYGNAFSPNVEMGSPGGTLGGALISIRAAANALVNGHISATGGSSGGGGRGGGILIQASNLIVRGMIEARGASGSGSEYYGGGGGGRIKLFYATGFTTKDASNLNVSGGAGGWRAVSGGTGSIWHDALPDPPVLIEPASDLVLTTNRLRFSLLLADPSAVTDGHDDDLCCVLELSTNDFASVFLVFDQSRAVAGWSDLAYRSGQQAEYLAQEPLPPGTYQWRASVADRSLFGPVSGVRSFTIIGPEQSPLRISKVFKSGTNVTIRWSGGRPPYQVESRTNWATSFWEPSGDPVATASVTFPAAATNAFYRVVGQ